MNPNQSEQNFGNLPGTTPENEYHTENIAVYEATALSTKIKNILESYAEKPINDDLFTTLANLLDMTGVEDNIKEIITLDENWGTSMGEMIKPDSINHLANRISYIKYPKD